MGSVHSRSACISALFIYLNLLLVPFVMAADDLAHSDVPAVSMADFCLKLPRAEYAGLESIVSPDDWFELYRVAPGVIAIYEPHQWQETISYLIEGQDKALLFDTGNGIADIAGLVHSLTDKPILVFNSHSHYDHVGGNHAFKDIYGMDTAFTRARQAGVANADISIEVSAAALCRRLPQGVSGDTHVGRPYTINHFIADGYVFDLGGRELEVLHIPGHTPDAVALIDRTAGLMWTGDTYYSGPIWLYAPETDFEAYRASIDRLEQQITGLKALLPAHNTPLVNPEVLPRVKAAVKKLLAGQLRAEDQGDGTVIYPVVNEDTFSFLVAGDSLPLPNSPANGHKNH